MKESKKSISLFMLLNGIGYILSGAGVIFSQSHNRSYISIYILGLTTLFFGLLYVKFSWSMLRDFKNSNLNVIISLLKIGYFLSFVFFISTFLFSGGKIAEPVWRFIFSTVIFLYLYRNIKRLMLGEL